MHPLRQEYFGFLKGLAGVAAKVRGAEPVVMRAGAGHQRMRRGNGWCSVPHSQPGTRQPAGLERYLDKS